MQLISLEKKITSDRILAGAEQEELDHLLNKAARKSGFEIEIGCGNGHFLTAYANKNKNVFITGIDTKPGRCRKVQKKIENNRLENAAVICGRAEQVVYNLPGESVDLFHIYFSDPWPKAKHKKRRFLRRENLLAICRILKPGGKIYFASDIFDYYLQAKVLFILQTGLALLDIQPPQELFNSLFAHKFNALEKDTHFVASVKG